VETFSTHCQRCYPRPGQFVVDVEVSSVVVAFSTHCQSCYPRSCQFVDDVEELFSLTPLAVVLLARRQSCCHSQKLLTSGACVAIATSVWIAAFLSAAVELSGLSPRCHERR
jgi:hypothetical protein